MSNIAFNFSINYPANLVGDDALNRFQLIGIGQDLVARAIQQTASGRRLNFRLFSPISQGNSKKYSIAAELQQAHIIFEDEIEEGMMLSSLRISFEPKDGSPLQLQLNLDQNEAPCFTYDGQIAEHYEPPAIHSAPFENAAPAA